MTSTETVSVPAPRAGRPVWLWLEALGLPWPLLVCLAALAAAPLFVTNAYVLRLLVTSLYFGTLAMAFDFTGGFINAVNFGFAGFVGLGGYTAALLAMHTQVGPWLGLLAAMVVAGLVGGFTGSLTLRLRGIYVSLMSWFVGLTLMALATAMTSVTHGSRGLAVEPLFGSANNTAQLYVLLTIMIVLYIVLRLIIRSRIGLAFKAIGQNYDVARASGVNPTLYKLMNFTLSCACAGLLGGFYAHFVGIVTPELMDTGHTLEIMALAYIGGSGSLLGGVFAAFMMIPLFDSLKKLVEYRLIIYGLSLIVIMIFYPAGLSGLYRLVVESAKKWSGKPPSHPEAHG